MFNGSNCDRKSQLSRILTEPLNPREISRKYLYLCKVNKNWYNQISRKYLYRCKVNKNWYNQKSRKYLYRCKVNKNWVNQISRNPEIQKIFV